MKKIIISMLFCFVTVYMFGQDVYKYFQEQKVSYKVSETKMLVKLKTRDITGVKKALQNPVAGSLKRMDELGSGLFFIEMKNTNKEDMWKLQRQFNSRKDVVYTSPVFGEGHGTGYTNEILVRIKSKDDYPVLQKCATLYNIKDIRTGKYFNPGTYILTLPHNSEKDAMQIAVELYETGLFLSATPNSIYLWPFASNDTYFPNQWNLKNTGQLGGTAGIDIKVEQAWTITAGSSSRKIAIVDTGVDLNHPDLVNNLLSGFNGYNSTNSGAPINTTYGDFPHGTKCAGVVAAQANNNKGIAGVAPGCKILPITAGESGYMNLEAIPNGINWAWHNGADVISMSYGGYTIDIDAKLAIDSAAIFGRNGKGCVMVACAQNQGQTNVSFPASHDQVIAVGAILNNGQRKIDSNHGPNLDVVAPGEGIYTTCMSGTTENIVINDGVNGIYTSNFSATSAATPHVAGIAALVLSKNSNLTATEVRSIISMTCRKLDGYAFETTSAHPYGSWNNEVGYGLVDAQAAVQAAICYDGMYSQTQTSNTFIRSCGDTFYIPTVTVTNNAKFTIKANKVVINSGVLTVQSGSQFEIR